MKYSRLILLAICCFIGHLTLAQTRYGTGSGTSGGSTNSYFGWYTGHVNTAPYNTFIGGSSGRVNTTGRYNTFLGHESGRLNTTGGFNVFLGDRSGYGNTKGEKNVYVGSQAGFSATTANNNTLIGNQSGYSNTTGRQNTFLGDRSGFKNVNGLGNVYLGYQAGFSGSTGRYNAIVGTQSGYSITTAVGNTMVGRASGRYATSGVYNAYLGHFAGYRGTTAGYNVALGPFAGFRNVTGLRNVFIGSYAGYNETGSNQLYIENTSADTPLIYGDFGLNCVGINTKEHTDAGTGDFYTLSVNGNFRAHEVDVYTGWADYVFEDDYKLRTLEEVETFIRKNKHLPDVPSAKVVEKEGISLGETSATLLRKIEELTLYMISSNKAMKTLQKKVEALEKENKRLKAKSQK